MSGSNGKILVAHDQSDRKVLMTRDPDRCEAQLTPGLEQQVCDLTRALKGLMAAAGDTSPANREEALMTARRVLALAASRTPTKG
jgi:hypothetical protein